ncbi:MAG: AAA family ATPase [Subdoligranulum sp.]|nr:AAA family ATPase [Subdoligranulum sp.]
MVGWMTVQETAERWNLTTRRVAVLCKENRIPGVERHGHRWLIPADAEKPADKRVRSGIYGKAAATSLLPLPVGVSDFKKAVTDYYYVDKTLLIRDFIDELPAVTLFTRPRRFGKTLNMDMIRTYFEKTEEDTSVYFKDKEIWKCGEKYRSYQGKYPVIFLTFKDTKFTTWADTLESIRFLFANEFQRHQEVADSPRCNNNEKEYYNKIIVGKASEGELMNALLVLSQMLDAHYGIGPVIIIDEYDIPIQQGHLQGFYGEAIAFMRNLFSGGFKDNRHLSYGFMTGILRVAKESIFSGLNNQKVNSVLDTRYSEYFGFTADEVKVMAGYYHVSDKLPEINEWYDGYRFGNSEIYNPWSVINYFANECRPRAFWVSTSSNDIIGEVLSGADEELYEKLNALLQGNSVVSYIDTDVVYPKIKENPSSVYSFLLVTGYLKAISTDYAMGDGYLCKIALPNREIASVYKKEILKKLTGLILPATAISIQEALYTGNADDLQKRLETLLLQSASMYDTVGELFYHGLMLGLTAIMDDRYLVTSNRESGEGRYDIQLKPKDSTLPGILIELKAAKNVCGNALKVLAQTALQQIDDRKYDTEMQRDGVAKILKYGIAFCGKRVEIIK